MGWTPMPDPQVYRMIWWGLGHSSQQINVAAMVSVWYFLGAVTIGGVVINEKISRSAFFLYVLFISMASAHHLLVDPGMGPAWKIWNTSYAMYLAVLASMIHGFTVPAGVGGKAAMEQLRAIDSGVKAVVSSGYSNDPVMSDFRSHGFMGVIAKPYSPDDLLRVVNEALSSPDVQ